jgi:pimeloyl-ACP methyl ester carboxylesterase
VLQALKVPPPYVLVGHSLGGVFIRGFASMYPGEAAGMGFLDVPDFESTREERAAGTSRRGSQAALAPPVLPEIPPGTPPGLAAVYQQQLNEMRDDYPSARNWRLPPGIPVAVVITTRADRMRGNGGAMVRLQMKHQSEWALGSPNSLFVLAGHTGHQVIAMIRTRRPPYRPCPYAGRSREVTVRARLGVIRAAAISSDCSSR